MDAFFVVPALISPNVNPRLVPAICKTIERNIILTHYASIRLALLRKYGSRAVVEESGVVDLRSEVLSNWTKSSTLKQEVLSEGPKLSDVSKIPKPVAVAGAEVAKVALGKNKEYPGSKESDILGSKASTAAKDAIEYPRGITFFNQIGLEPTFLQIPVTMKKSGGLSRGLASRVLMVGVKCVAYQVDGVDDLTALITDYKGRSEIKRWFMKRVYNVLTKIPFTIPRSIRKHGTRGGQKAPSFKTKRTPGTIEYDIRKDVIFAPDSETLAKPRELSKMMSVQKPTTWSTVTVLSTVDFEDKELRDTLLMYRDLAKAGWGDLVIANEAKESSYFCTTKMGACYEMPLSYMRNIMNLDNVLDYAEVSRWNKPFRIAPLRKALTEGTNPDNQVTKPEAVLFEMNNIIRGDDEDEEELYDEMDIGGEDEELETSVGGFDLSDEAEEPDYDDFKSGASKVVRDMDGEEDGSWHDPFDPGTIRRPGFGDYSKEKWQDKE